MRLFSVVINPRCFVKPDDRNPLLGIFSQKNKAEQLAEKHHGYYVAEKELDFNEWEDIPK